ncbi:DJ-1/PfpI/YhbO family deglycase/protease [bacterium]|nr:DJ-1/PfpI/YhbO family deglycase/protease [bacterium]
MNLFGASDKEKDTLVAAPIPEAIKKQAKVVIITADDTQDLEFFYPYYRFTEEGYHVDVVTPKGGSFKGKYGLGLSHTKPIGGVKPDDYALLYIPGGKAPQELRRNREVLAFISAFAQTGKPIAAICHGPQVLIESEVVFGRRMAAWPEVAQELQDAGAHFVDEELVIDGPFITSRMPGDLPRHLAGTLDYLKQLESSAQDDSSKHTDRHYSAAA